MKIVKDIKSTCFDGFVIAVVLLFSSVALVSAEVNTNNDNDFLRIIYSGGLIGNIQPCG